MQTTVPQYIVDSFEAEHIIALEKAKNAGKELLQQIGGDRMACGFAWVNIRGVRKNSALGKILLKNGFDKSYDGALQIWNPSGLPVQNIDTKEAGAYAYANHMRQKFPELQIYAGSTLD